MKTSSFMGKIITAGKTEKYRKYKLYILHTLYNMFSRNLL